MNELERSLAFVPSAAELAHVKALPPQDLPLISVVIPSLNQGSYLAETLASVVRQAYPRVEIFVADGGSTDNTLEVLASFNRQHSGLLRHISEPDGGQQHAVNKGIDATTGEIVAWINSDDVYLPDAFWKVVTFFYYNRGALIVYGRNHYTDENLRPVMEYPVDWSPLLGEQRRRMMHFCLPPQPSLFFKRMAVTLAGKLTSHILDYELWLRWQEHLPFFFLDDFLSLSRLHAEAKTVSARRQLIDGICKTVHQYYNTVPYSWLLSRVYHDTYGNSWTRGESNPVTKTMKLKALVGWALYNVQLAPKVVPRKLRLGLRNLRWSLRGRV